MKLSTTFLRFLAYVKQPIHYNTKIAVVSPLKTFWQLFKINLYSMILLSTMGFVFVWIGKLIGITEPEGKFKDNLQTIFFIVIVAPLFEELLFRWPLRYSFNKVSVAGVLGFLVLYSETYKIQTFDKMFFCIGFFAGFIAIPFLISYYKKQISAFWVTNFRWVYWSLALVFGLIHLTNYDGSWSSFLLFWPVLCINQTVGGLLFGYARMRYGFWYGVALHATNNAIPGLLIVFDILGKK